MFAKLIASASVYLVAKTLYKHKVKPEVETPPEVVTPVPEVKVTETESKDKPSKTVPLDNPYYRYTSAVHKNTEDLNVLRDFYNPEFIVSQHFTSPQIKVDPVEEITSEKLGKRVESKQRSTDSLYHERKRKKKKTKRKAPNRANVPKGFFVPPTVEPTHVSVELLDDLKPGQSHARHQTPLRFRRSRSARRT